MEVAYKRTLLSSSYENFNRRMKVISAICGDNYPDELKLFLEEQELRMECNELYREICQLRLKQIPGETVEKELKVKITEYAQKTAEYEAKKTEFEAMLLRLEKMICVA